MLSLNLSIHLFIRYYVPHRLTIFTQFTHKNRLQNALHTRYSVPKQNDTVYRGPWWTPELDVALSGSLVKCK